MATTVLQRSIQSSKLFDKSLFIEMDNAPSSKDIPFEGKSPQPKQISYNLSETSRIPPFQGSQASLESKFADQSEVQPLTQDHKCRYDECHKFCENKPPKELQSPVSPLKMAFLFLVIILLILWIIIYIILTQLGLL